MTRSNDRGILVSDFDGTLTEHDFYQLAVAHLLPPDVPDYWRDYRAGRITHFEALRNYFAAIRAPLEDVLAVVDSMNLETNLAALVAELRGAGWDVIVASAGCEWYIRHLLARAGVDVELHANPGDFMPGRGLLMELPTGSPYYSAEFGIDKAAIVRAAQVSGRPVAFAGDGYPDAAAARLVPPALRFARGALAESLRSQGISFQSFAGWAEVVRSLL